MKPAMVAVLALATLATLAEAGRDYYEVLGIEKKANDKEIKKVRALFLFCALRPPILHSELAARSGTLADGCRLPPHARHTASSPL